MKRRPRFVVKQQAGVASKGHYYWLLIGANNEVLAHSESFQYRSQARDAAKNARRLAALAKVER